MLTKTFGRKDQDHKAREGGEETIEEEERKEGEDGRKSARWLGKTLRNHKTTKRGINKEGPRLEGSHREREEKGRVVFRDAVQY